MKEILPGWLMVDVPDMTGEVTLRSTAHCNSSISFYNKFTQKETLVVTPPGSYEIVGIVSEEGMVDVARSNGFEPERTLLIRKLK